MAAEPDKVNTGALATVVVVGAIVIVVVVALLTVYVRRELEAEVERKGGRANTSQVRELHQKQEQVLTEEPRWADQAKGTVRIPIGKAMELLERDLRKNPLAASPGAPPPSAAPVDSAAAATGMVSAEPVPSAAPSASGAPAAAPSGSAAGPLSPSPGPSASAAGSATPAPAASARDR